MAETLGEGQVIISVKAEGDEKTRQTIERLLNDLDRLDKGRTSLRGNVEQTKAQVAEDKKLNDEIKRGNALLASRHNLLERIEDIKDDEAKNERRAAEEAARRRRREEAEERRRRDKARRDLERDRRALQGISRGVGAPLRGFLSAIVSVASFGLAAGLIGGLVATGAEAVRLADDLFLAEQRMKTFALAGEDVAESLAALSLIARQNGSDIIATTRLYNQFQQSLAVIGGTAKDALQNTETFLQILRISGVSGSEQRASTQQFIQGYRANRFAGDELRSILENVGFLGVLFRRQFGEANIRDVGARGEITRDVVERIFEENRAEIQLLAGSIQLSLSQLLAGLQNQFGVASFEAFRDSGLTNELQLLLTDLTEAFDDPRIKKALTDMATELTRFVAALRQDLVPNLEAIIGHIANIPAYIETITLSLAAASVVVGGARGFREIQGIQAAGGFLGGRAGVAGIAPLLGNLSRLLPVVGSLVSAYALFQVSGAFSRTDPQQQRREQQPAGIDFDTILNRGSLVRIGGLGSLAGVAFTEGFKQNLDIGSTIDDQLQSLREQTEDAEISLRFRDDPAARDTQLQLVRRERELRRLRAEAVTNQEKVTGLIKQREILEGKISNEQGKQVRALDSLLPKIDTFDVRLRSIVQQGADLSGRLNEANDLLAILENTDKGIGIAEVTLPADTANRLKALGIDLRDSIAGVQAQVQSLIPEIKAGVLEIEKDFAALDKQIQTTGVENDPERRRLQDALRIYLDSLKQVNALITERNALQTQENELGGDQRQRLAAIDDELGSLRGRNDLLNEYNRLRNEIQLKERVQAAGQQGADAGLQNLFSGIRDASVPTPDLSEATSVDDYVQRLVAGERAVASLDEAIAASLFQLTGSDAALERLAEAQGRLNLATNESVEAFLSQNPALREAIQAYLDYTKGVEAAELAEKEREIAIRDTIRLGDEVGSVIARGLDRATTAGENFLDVLRQTTAELAQIAKEEFLLNPVREYFRDVVVRFSGVTDEEAIGERTRPATNDNVLGSVSGISGSPGTVNNNRFEISSINPTETARLVGDVIQGAGIEGGSVYINNPSLNRD